MADKSFFSTLQLQLEATVSLRSSAIYIQTLSVTTAALLGQQSIENRVWGVPRKPVGTQLYWRVIASAYPLQHRSAAASLRFPVASL
jgi:hypothetical protein